MKNHEKAEWDDVPQKVVGRRKTEHAGHNDGFQLQELMNTMGGNKVFWPRGIFRFKSHEKAEAW